MQNAAATNARLVSAIVAVDVDNALSGSSASAPSVEAFAEALRLREIDLLGGLARVRVAYLGPQGHPDALRAFARAGYEVRVTPCLTQQTKSCADGHIIVDVMERMHATEVETLLLVSGDTDFCVLAQAAHRRNVETIIATPGDAPAALANAGLVVVPLWPPATTTSTQTRAASIAAPSPAASLTAVAHHPVTSLPSAAAAEPSGSDPAHASQAVSAPAARSAPEDGVPRKVYAQPRAPADLHHRVGLRFQDMGLAFPSVDGERMRDLLGFFLMLDEGTRYPIKTLSDAAKDRNLRMTRAEVGFVHAAVTRGAQILGEAGADASDLRACFVEGVLAIGEFVGAHLPREAAGLLTEWLTAAPMDVTGMMGDGERSTAGA